MPSTRPPSHGALPSPATATLVVTGLAFAVLLAAAAAADPVATPHAPAADAPALHGAPPAAARAASIPLPSIRAELASDGRVVLTGIVPDATERDRIVRRARQLHGAGHVEDRLAVGDVGNPAWLSPEFVPDLRQVAAGRWSLDDGVLRVEGDVRSAAALARLRERLAELHRRGIAVDNRLRIATEPATLPAVAR